jgi:hypothetical protein
MLPAGAFGKMLAARLLSALRDKHR